MTESGALLRQKSIIGDRRAGIPPLVEVSQSLFKQWVKNGLFPAPVRLPGGRAVAWRESDVRAWIEARSAGEPVPVRLGDTERRVLVALLRGPLLATQAAALTVPHEWQKAVGRLRRAAGLELPIAAVGDTAQVALSAGDRDRAAALLEG